LRPVVEGDDIACETTLAGTSCVSSCGHRSALLPEWPQSVFELMNIFRYDDQGRVVEEWVQADNGSRLRQLGVEWRLTRSRSER
jgi:hypothetical protein